MRFLSDLPIPSVVLKALRSKKVIRKKDEPTFFLLFFADGNQRLRDDCGAFFVALFFRISIAGFLRLASCCLLWLCLVFVCRRAESFQREKGLSGRLSRAVFGHTLDHAFVFARNFQVRVWFMRHRPKGVFATRKVLKAGALI